MNLRNPNYVSGNAFVIQVSASGRADSDRTTSGRAQIRCFGHSFFEITSSGGTVAITDPFGPMGYPMPEVRPQVVTVGREHGNHINVGLAKGDPVVLPGVNKNFAEFNDINVNYRDVLIYNVPVRGYVGYREGMMGSAFVFEMNEICVLHAGDINKPLNEAQLQLVGHIDVLLVPIGGTYTAGPAEAGRIVEQLKPKIVIPMRFWLQKDTLASFVDGPYPGRFLDTDRITVSRDSLPVSTDIYVLEVGMGSGS